MAGALNSMGPRDAINRALLARKKIDAPAMASRQTVACFKAALDGGRYPPSSVSGIGVR